MAGNSDRYAAALQHWDEYSNAGNFSVPSDMGKVAILCPYVDTYDSHREEVDKYPKLEAEAFSIADDLQQRGKTPIVAQRAKPYDFAQVLKDPSISHVLLIGHGCLSSVEVENPTSDDARLDWENLAAMADHLKTGSFIQRMCGTTPRKLNVPLGLMVVSEHRNVLAPLGESFAPQDTADPQNELVKPVTRLARMEYADIKRDFPQQKLPFSSRAHVVLGGLKKSVLDAVA